MRHLGRSIITTFRARRFIIALLVACAILFAAALGGRYIKGIPDKTFAKPSKEKNFVVEGGLQPSAAVLTYHSDNYRFWYMNWITKAYFVWNGQGRRLCVAY